VNGAVTGEHGEQHDSIVPQEEPHFPPPIHEFGHGDVKIRTDAMLEHDVDNHAPPKPPLPRMSPVGAGHKRSDSTCQNGGESPRRHRTESQRLRCTSSLRRSDCAALGHITVVVSGRIGAMAHETPPPS
jgi:hypothetical protein